MGRAAIISALVCLLGACSGPAERDNAPQPASEAVVASSAEEGGVNLDLWLERLEVGSRELYKAREAVVAAIGLKDGDRIADIGAGTGLYTLMFAEAVGPSGHVFAEDIEPLFLDLINRRAEDMGFENITAVYGRKNSVSLPKNSVDVVFIADTYHYFSDREAIMKTAYEALAPGGMLVIVDYEIASGMERTPENAHVLFGKAGVTSEVEFIGFEGGADVAVEGLVENYFLKFAKP